MELKIKYCGKGKWRLYDSLGKKFGGVVFTTNGQARMWAI